MEDKAWFRRPGQHVSVPRLLVVSLISAASFVLALLLGDDLVLPAHMVAPFAFAFVLSFLVFYGTTYLRMTHEIELRPLGVRLLDGAIQFDTSYSKNKQQVTTVKHDDFRRITLIVNTNKSNWYFNRIKHDSEELGNRKWYVSIEFKKSTGKYKYGTYVLTNEIENFQQIIDVIVNLKEVVFRIGDKVVSKDQWLTELANSGPTVQRIFNSLLLKNDVLDVLR